MTRYVTVAVTQVQRWISRSPDLAGRRGASALLTEQTSMARWKSALPLAGFDEWTWNTEAGSVAGVVSLREEGIVGGPDRPGELAVRVVERLRAGLPAASFAASWYDGPSYMSAYTNPVGSFLSQPTGLEIPLALPCQACHQSPATARTTDKKKVCFDCAARNEASGNSRRIATPLRPLAAALGESSDGVVLSAPRTLADLAKVGHTKASDAATRIAVVYADGNNLGKVLKSLADKGGELASIAADVNDATMAAFVAAAREHCVVDAVEEQPALGVIPHIVGGDDVVASVCAHMAWPFVECLAREFKATLGKALWLRGQHVPDLSVGLVFQHRSEPLTHSIERAAARLGAAKGAMSRAALSWVDLQIDGPDVFHPARDLEWLTSHLPVARSLAAQPSSRRQALRSELARGGWQRARRVLERHGLDELRVLLDRVSAPDREADLLWLLQIAKDVRPG